MKKIYCVSRIAALFFAIFGLAGCPKNPIGWVAAKTTGSVWVIFVEALKEAKDSYIPTDYRWWGLAIVTALLLPWRFPKLRPKICKVGALLLVVCSIRIFGKALLAAWWSLIILAIVYIIRWKLGESGEGGKKKSFWRCLKDDFKALAEWKDGAKKRADELAGEHPEEDAESKKKGLAVRAYLYSFWIMAVLFGGTIPDNWEKAGTMGQLDMVLWGIGCALATIVPLVFLLHDLWVTHWVCERCHEMNWFNLFDNQKYCKDEYCEGYNPKYPWKCDSGHDNQGWRTECKIKGCKGERPKRKDWDDSSDEGPTCKKCDQKLSKGNPYCPNKECKYPNPKEVWTCHMPDCGQEGIPGSSLICLNCGKVRKGLAIQWVPEAKRLQAKWLKENGGETVREGAKPPPKARTNPAPKPPPERVPCVSCGKALKKGYAVCPYCGTSQQEAAHEEDDEVEI